MFYNDGVSSQPASQEEDRVAESPSRQLVPDEGRLEKLRWLRTVPVQQRANVSQAAGCSKVQSLLPYSKQSKVALFDRNASMMAGIARPVKGTADVGVYTNSLRLRDWFGLLTTW